MILAGILGFIAFVVALAPVPYSKDEFMGSEMSPIRAVAGAVGSICVWIVIAEVVIR